MCHNSFHLAVIFTFMAAKISLCRWKRIIIDANQGCVLDITSIFFVKYTLRKIVFINRRAVKSCKVGKLPSGLLFWHLLKLNYQLKASAAFYSRIYTYVYVQFS